MQDRDDLDAAIDRVAHAMTDAAPSRRLREAVEQRIAASTPIARSWRTWSMTAAATALVVMAFLVWRERASETPTVRVAEQQSPAVERTAPAAALVDETRRPAAGVPVRVTSANPLPGRSAARQTVTAATSDLLLIRPLSIDPIGTGGVEVETMSVPAGLAIDPIAVAPMRLRELGQSAE